MRPPQLPFHSTNSETAGKASGVLPSDKSLAGEVVRVTYHDDESGFCVLRVRVPGRTELAVVVGRTPGIAAGQFLRADGQWRRDKKHGPQFAAENLALSTPTTADGAQRYLASGQVPGVGPELARRMVSAFGNEVFDVIERTPARLREVEGVGPVRAERIARSFRAGRQIRDLMVFLHSHGIGSARAVRIHKTYGERAIEAIRADPYALARDVRGIGFPTADALAERLGIARDAPERLCAGLRHLLREAQSEGHCGLPQAELLARAEPLLSAAPAAFEAPLQSLLGSGEFVAENWQQAPAIFQSTLCAAERQAVHRLTALSAGATPWPPIDAEKAIPWVQDQLGIELAPSQREAVGRLLGAKVAVLTGGPGVGKTTLVRTLLQVLRAKQVRVELAAPTGRAAKRLAQASGLPARTLHRLLEASPSDESFRRTESRPLDLDLLVVDECSMIDSPLFSALLCALPKHAALLLVGDAEQLPPVGPGQPFADLVSSEAVPIVRLRELFRQAQTSQIVQAAHAVRRGKMPELAPAEAGEARPSAGTPDRDFFFVETSEAEQVLSRIGALVAERIPARFGLDPVRDVQVLSPMRRGSLGSHNLNTVLQEQLQPGSRGNRESIVRAGTTFSVGDKVMQLSNDYERDVYNGDVGFVESIDTEERELIVSFDERKATYAAEDMDALALAYAITIHKAQGSEYPAVVIALTSQHYPMLRRDLLYTAITRGRQLVVIVGQRRALSLALRADAAPARVSKLREWLEAG